MRKRKRTAAMSTSDKICRMTGVWVAAVAAIALLQSGTGRAEPLGYAAPLQHPALLFGQVPREPESADEIETPTEIPARLHRHVVDYSTRESPGTIIIDTPNTYLYFILGGGKAIRYGIGVGREGFTWSGVKAIERKAEWPDWIPPAEMLQRQPYLPRFMAGGPGNPLGARAMYIGGTVYRIHGTNAPSTIGKQVSSGCIRMLNEDVIDLYARTNVGTKVVVLPMQAGRPQAVATHATERTVANVALAHSIY
jgi:lipoprotein-anchoring transpeptidase ErfK/SrfK